MNPHNLLVKWPISVSWSSFVQKPLHEFFYNQIDKDHNIDKRQRLAWKKDRFVKSDLGGYMGKITEQELLTKK